MAVINTFSHRLLQLLKLLPHCLLLLLPSKPITLSSNIIYGAGKLDLKADLLVFNKNRSDLTQGDPVSGGQKLDDEGTVNTE